MYTLWSVFLYSAVAERFGTGWTRPGGEAEEVGLKMEQVERTPRFCLSRNDIETKPAIQKKEEKKRKRQHRPDVREGSWKLTKILAGSHVDDDLKEVQEQ